MKNNEHYEQLWENYQELESRILEILDLIDEIVGTNHELSTYMRETGFYQDDVVCGEYRFPFKWLSFENSEITKALNGRSEWKLEKEKALIEKELTELKRLKYKYERGKR